MDMDAYTRDPTVSFIARHMRLRLALRCYRVNLDANEKIGATAAQQCCTRQMQKVAPAMRRSSNEAFLAFTPHASRGFRARWYPLGAHKDRRSKLSA